MGASTAAPRTTERTSDRLVARERRLFMRYVLRGAEIVGFDAPAEVLREAVPREYRAWRLAYTVAYGGDPSFRSR
jgi:hypothetical protein